MRAKAMLASGLVVVLAGCSERAAEVSAQWGCGQVDGLKQITSAKAPGYILVGEFTETSEAPAAFAELACNLAARQGEGDGPLFVGLMEYVGGATDAETKVRARLDEVIAKGAPIVVGTLGGEDHPFTVRNRSAAEAKWAKVIEGKVDAAGASRALLLLPRADAIAEPIAPTGDRFAGYAPMATHLPEGQVVALEIASAPVNGLTAPAIRIYPVMTDGFHGQVALASLTRPATPLLVAEARTPERISPFLTIGDDELRALIRPEMNWDERMRVLTARMEAGYSSREAMRSTRGNAAARAAPPSGGLKLSNPPDTAMTEAELKIAARRDAEQLVERSWSAQPVQSDTAPANPLLPTMPEPLLDLPEFEIEN
ncbi:MAG: hypothetical protein Q8R02_06875 [Hyphomonadaceae bacterium]|nr:hypothetical protein [Hyphomonadaceae bacterium]